MGCQRKAARIIGIGRVNLSRKKILVNVSSFAISQFHSEMETKSHLLQALFTPKEVARLHPTIVSVTLFFTEPYTSLHSTFCHHNAHVSCNNRHKRQLVSRAELQLSREAVSRVAEAKKNYKGGTSTTLTRRLESEHAKNSKRGQF